MTIAIFGLWRNWAVAVGVLTVLAFLAPIVPRIWLLPIDVAAYAGLQIIRHVLRKRDVPSCMRLLQEASTIVLIAAVAVAIISILLPTGLLHEFSGDPITDNSPFIAILITAPATCIVTACFLLNRTEPQVCRQCKARYGNIIEHGFIGDLFRREWRYQTRLLMLLSLALTLIDWSYYIIQYVNVNLNRSDFFFFLWIPLVIYILSLIYLGTRYYYMWVYYCQKDEANIVQAPASTTLRYLLIHNNSIFIDMPGLYSPAEAAARGLKFDTPVIVKIPYREQMPEDEAARLFKSRTGINDAEIRRIYQSPDPLTYQNIFHYFAFIQNATLLESAKISGEWISLGELFELNQHEAVNRILVAEIHRIYEVAMAWKTYDKEGKRLYNIKHYHPTFRLRDVQKWDVDYSDDTWLKISRHNEDKPLWRLHRFFTRIFNRFHFFIA